MSWIPLLNHPEPAFKLLFTHIPDFMRDLDDWEDITENLTLGEELKFFAEDLVEDGFCENPEYELFLILFLLGLDASLANNIPLNEICDALSDFYHFLRLRENLEELECEEEDELQCDEEKKEIEKIAAEKESTKDTVENPAKKMKVETSF